MSLLSLVSSALTVDQLLPAPDRIIVIAKPKCSSAPCPLCGRAATRVHSTYCRQLADLPWQGRTVELRVTVRRFRCTNLACRRRIFAECLDEVTTPRARRT